MAAFTLPDPRDVKDTITDCLTTLPFGPLTADQREQVINSCVRPISLLIEAGNLASAGGVEVEAVFIYFIRTLNAQMGFYERQAKIVDT